MRKGVFFLLLCSLSLNVYASNNCVAGKIITGKNGHEYCISNETMNWWSAFQWCAAQGRHLVTPTEACDYGNKVWGGGTCVNLEQESEAAWTSLSNSNKEYAYNVGNGYIFGTRYGLKVYDSLFKALCY